MKLLRFDTTKRRSKDNRRSGLIKRKASREKRRSQEERTYKNNNIIKSMFPDLIIPRTWILTGTTTSKVWSYKDSHTYKIHKHKGFLGEKYIITVMFKLGKDVLQLGERDNLDDAKQVVLIHSLENTFITGEHK